MNLILKRSTVSACFSTREVLKIIQNLNAPLVGADLVEFNPRRDPVGITAMLAAKLLKEMAAKMLRSTKDAFGRLGRG